MTKVTLGGNRLGSGNKQTVSMRNFERSSHDIGYMWKSTISAGTLVPFMSELALPGDTMDIFLDCDVLTHPTKGPLFGSFKVQLDVFVVPIRLYNAKLHMNMLGIGMEMNKVAFPQLRLNGKAIDEGLDSYDNLHTDPSSILAHLDIRGTGHSAVNNYRDFCAVPYLGYWDIYKQYYANKQEDLGVVIHNREAVTNMNVVSMTFHENEADTPGTVVPLDNSTSATIKLQAGSKCVVVMDAIDAGFDSFKLQVMDSLAIAGQFKVKRPLRDFFGSVSVSGVEVTFRNTLNEWDGVDRLWHTGQYDNSAVDVEGEPRLQTFELKNIDTMRQQLLTHFADTPYLIDENEIAPYGLPLDTVDGAAAAAYGQEGLACKTYQSDLFNNWISTEWIDGADGISAITAIDTTGDSFTIDELNLSRKVYDMLNRIALSGGSYDDWLDAVYTEDRKKSTENPVYIGGLQQSLVFQEVVSTADTQQVDGIEGDPLGTLAGRGKLGGNKKGGKIIAKIDEPSFILGIASLTPHVDFSQGNKWSTNLKNMDDLHKPSLDQIGFQDLITDAMAWFDTATDAGGVSTFKSAGKQPAWINYMTNVNKVRGNFARPDDQMFMTLNRRYSKKDAGGGVVSIEDLTTYIDPAKYNYIFANVRRDAMNFWMQIAVNITARRKMSAKVIPNL